MAKKKAKKSVKKAPQKSGTSTAKAPVQPLADRVLVRREDMPDKKSAAGIILPDSAQKEKSKLGVVLATGPGRITDDGKTVPVALRVGDKVIFNSGWDNEVTLENDESDYFLVRESDILAILNK